MPWRSGHYVPGVGERVTLGPQTMPLLVVDIVPPPGGGWTPPASRSEDPNRYVVAWRGADGKVRESSHWSKGLQPFIAPRNQTS